MRLLKCGKIIINRYLNNLKTNSCQQFVRNKLSSIRGESILFSTSDINVALYSLKSGKSCGVDDIVAEHFLFAHRITHVFLFLSFNTFILHGYYLPADFMKTAIVPIIKNKKGDTSDKNNHRPIALVTAASKLFEICILEILETYLILMIINSDLRISTPQTCVYLLLKLWLNITLIK